MFLYRRASLQANPLRRLVRVVKYEKIWYQASPSFPELTSEKIAAKSLVQAFGFTPSFPESTSEKVVAKSFVRALGSFFSKFLRVNIRKSSLKVIGPSTRIFFRVSEFLRVSIRQSSLKVTGSSIRIFSELPRDINANVTSVKVFVRIHSIGWFRS